MKNSKPELFRNTLGHPVPPVNLGPHEKALWYAGKGEWEKAHEIVQDLSGRYAPAASANLEHLSVPLPPPQQSSCVPWMELDRTK